MLGDLWCLKDVSECESGRGNWDFTNTSQVPDSGVLIRRRRLVDLYAFERHSS